ncbi:catalase [Shewanella sp. VB17]|uniref:catalase n=1 Tax=Shewanella sp. VB17 TaxID=2739432 RepID=UPI001565E401|nr:catalase [Shewanella sp. VB17]NRD75025.1 catalase [Shewanella sp. VB17]
MIKAIVGLSFSLFVTSSFATNIHQNAENMVTSFEKKFGVTEGKRRNHTKGFCFEGELIPNPKAMQRYTTNLLFLKEAAVIGRLSHKGGNNHAPDNKAAEYGMGLSINTSDGVNNMSMNTLDFFPVSTPEDFANLMFAKTQGSAAVKAFKAKNTDLQRFSAHNAKKEKKLIPYEGSTFNSINSFYLVDQNGKKTAVRWSFIPTRKQLVVLEPKADFFYENMQNNVNTHGVSWDMVITVANPDDEVDNAAIEWVGEHTKITAATLKVISLSSEKNGQCDTINYDPMVLSQGLIPSQDPLLQARRNSYAISFGKRILEKREQQ